ncbi:MAG: DUF2784 domain-containing protein [Candidatus Omnitrophica bacterium]|nr:DUF2784 domain-containing protein [Candidatus Omnitrophota bacterium]MCB9770362.1 DUF2784 domain-containing protein [Candidatus Omnitrophota bacterium]MCB9784385.1 DUF2784 domain-containing protein [Candidatus Omnitrophota bacterium]
MKPVYNLLADIVLVLHFSYVLFVVVGQILILLGWWRGWPWTRYLSFRIVHLACIAVVVLQSWLGIICPLTVLEYKLRQLGGTASDEQSLSFIGYWVNRILFYQAPMWVFGLCYSLFGLLVVITFVWYPPRRKVRLLNAMGGDIRNDE